MRLDDVTTADLREATLAAIRELGRATNAHTEKVVADALSLDDADRVERVANGTITKLGYRVAWCRTALKGEGLIAQAGRGVWTPLTDQTQVAADGSATADAKSTSMRAPAPSLFPWHRLTSAEVLLCQRQVLRELRRRSLVRGRGAVVGDLAEWLVATAYDGTLAPPSQRAHDVDLPNGTRVQVKARVVSFDGPPGERQLGTIRHHDYDILVGVLIDDEDLTVIEALEIGRDLVERFAAKKGDQLTLHLNDKTIAELLAAGAVRITDLLRATAESLADPPGVPGGVGAAHG